LGFTTNEFQASTFDYFLEDLINLVTICSLSQNRYDVYVKLMFYSI